MANRTRNIQLKICLNEEEKQIFEIKMKLTKCKTMSHFIRKSILEGDIFVVDIQPFVDLQGLLYNAARSTYYYHVKQLEKPDKDQELKADIPIHFY